ncbi:hypothetical protein K8Z49_37780 [Actinomadura madurae]|uniref:ABC transporter C-terminal domain-containing protein n=1 Tax=Actinomadura madurae TaxID=1993 RepID=UPI0039998C1A
MDAWPAPPVNQYRKACAELDRLEQLVEELIGRQTELHDARTVRGTDAEDLLEINAELDSLRIAREQAEEQWLLLAYALPKPCDRCSGGGGRVDSLMFGNGGWSGLTTAKNPTVWVPCRQCEGRGSRFSE